jgi:pimeloyl-ACP methyl ester carboxylesterase
MLHTESIKTSILDIAFHRYGSASNRTVILLHGWPDCALTWHEVALSLASKDLHVLVPYLRGYGPTRFLHDNTPRSGQLSALAQDVIDFADALGIEKFDVVGHDWGARAAYISACLWPHHIRTCTAMSVGWGTNNADQPLSLNQVQNYWYHWYMATPRAKRWSVKIDVCLLSIFGIFGARSGKYRQPNLMLPLLHLTTPIGPT